MKILFGVQGTGNGHITRARVLEPHLRAAGVELDFLFSGRSPEHYFDMEQFGDYRCLAGLTFTVERGKINVFKTLANNKLMQFFKDIRQLDLSDYDLILSDYEPISAWAARRQNKTCINVSHQSAFNFAIPIEGDSLLTRTLMKWFAPADIKFGLHWHHFGHPILPPLIDVKEQPLAIEKNKVVVYLNFEAVQDVIPLLQKFPSTNFYYYGPHVRAEQLDNVFLRPLSRAGFQHDLASSEGVITNAGFELASEALFLGKKILVKPITGQMEQYSNALALRRLGLGMSMTSLDEDIIKTWLQAPRNERCIYPDVAKTIANYLTQQDFSNYDVSQLTALSQKLWASSTMPEIDSISTESIEGESVRY